MGKNQAITFTGPGAQLQYHLLMGLFRLSVTRGLFGRFARGLGRVFPHGNAVLLRQHGAPPFKIYLNDGYWTRFALHDPPYEPEIGRILTAASGKVDLFCDLGANKGYWTTRASALFRQVIAVEASGSTFRQLQENAAHLPNVTLHRVAIHSRSGESLDFVNVQNSHASAHLLTSGNTMAGDETEAVTTLRIDDLVPQRKPALIKLDVEGAEIAAFDGAERAIKNGSVLIYEDHGSDSTCAPSAHLLSKDQISLYSTEKHPVMLTSVGHVRAFKKDRFKGYNFVAARKDSPLLAKIITALQNSGEPATSDIRSK